MSLKFTCQLCGGDATDPNKRVPGSTKLGRVMLEQYVCDGCHQKTAAMLSDHFKDASAADPSRCGCGCECCTWDGTFPDGPYHAHLRPLFTGEWKLMTVCGACFAHYHDACRTNAEKR